MKGGEIRDINPEWLIFSIITKEVGLSLRWIK